MFDEDRVMFSFRSSKGGQLWLAELGLASPFCPSTDLVLSSSLSRSLPANYNQSHPNRTRPRALISFVFPFIPPDRGSLSTMPARNPTGFDMAQFKAAASPSSAFAKRDPWVRK